MAQMFNLGGKVVVVDYGVRFFGTTVLEWSRSDNGTDRWGQDSLTPLDVYVDGVLDFLDWQDEIAKEEGE